MKSNSSSPGAMPRYLAASLLLTLLPLTGQTLVNRNFDAQAPFTLSNGYASGNGGVITGWTISNPAHRAQPGRPTFRRSHRKPERSDSQRSQCLLHPGFRRNRQYLASGDGLDQRNQIQCFGPVLRSCRPAAGPCVHDRRDRADDDPGSGQRRRPLQPHAYRTAAFEFTATATSNTITFTNDRTSGDTRCCWTT